MLHACLLPITLCFTCASWCFYGFSATNILTRCHSASFYFLLFLIPEKLQRKYSRNRQRKLFYEVLHQKTPEARRGHLGEAWWAHTTPKRGQGGGGAQGCVATLWPPLRLSFGLLESSGVKLRKIVCFVNSENISCVTFLKPKNSRKQKLALWHLVNMLVAGNP